MRLQRAYRTRSHPLCREVVNAVEDGNIRTDSTVWECPTFATPNPKDLDLDACYDTHEEFVEAVSAFLTQHDDHKFDLTAQPLKIKATLSSTFCIDNDVSIGACAVSTDGDLQRRHAHGRRDGAKFSFNCPASVDDRPAERDPSTIQRYTVQKQYFECHGEFHISFSKANASATVMYEHIGHTESRKFHITDEVRNYIRIYRNMIQMTNPEAHVITRKQVYNFWISLTQGEWHRDVDDFKYAQLLVAEQYEILGGLQEPGISLAYVTPCFTDSQKFDRSRMTEVFIDATFGTNRYGFELYCVLTEYDLVSLPLSYLLLDTRGIQEDGKRGSRLTTCRDPSNYTTYTS
ncbi:hypothetical protein V1525DRAFT_440141 [Lipomyces kononenkoae]|uniref:Uncharacterized protein n=1 Tax=Lipomyces kononenkoae TaxID=34357 RepID=A0ACC3SR09_LIPKO